MTAPTFPPGRYGRRREPRRRRWLTALVAALAVAGAVTIAVVLYQRYGSTDYRPQVVRYSEIGDDTISIEFRVRVPAGAATVCLVRARGEDGAEVGRVEVRAVAPAGVRTARSTVRLDTTARPVTGEVLRCRPA